MVLALCPLPLLCWPRQSRSGFFFLQVIYLREIKTNLVYSKTYIPWWKHQTADTGAELEKKKKNNWQKDERNYDNLLSAELWAGKVGERAVLLLQLPGVCC